MRRPALLGGEPAFDEPVAFVRPALPALERVSARLQPSWDSGMLTNGPLVRELEASIALRLGVPHVIAVASCTAGLMLVFRAMGDDRPVVMPSFTFSASAHAVAWNARDTLFAECDPSTFQLDLADAVTRSRGASALLATHVFGAPCDPEAVEQLGERLGVPVVFDAAHALGSAHGDRAVGGFGLAEVFSLTPTKPLVAGEGGLVATRDAALAEAVRIGRDYANPGDYDTQFVGLNARMSELHAAVALESLTDFDECLVKRREIARRYRGGLAGLPGVAVQEIPSGDSSTFKDFTIRVDDSFGVSRDVLRAALRADGVDTRCYFDPPVHRQHAYRRATDDSKRLPITDDTASRVLSLPIYPALTGDVVDRVVGAIRGVHHHAAELDDRLEVLVTQGERPAGG